MEAPQGPAQQPISWVSLWQRSQNTNIQHTWKAREQRACTSIRMGREPSMVTVTALLTPTDTSLQNKERKKQTNDFRTLKRALMPMFLLFHTCTGLQEKEKMDQRPLEDRCQTFGRRQPPLLHRIDFSRLEAAVIVACHRSHERGNVRDN